MQPTDKSPKERYSFGETIQKRARCLLEALIDHADEAIKFGNGFKKEEIQLTLLNSGSNAPGLEFNIKRKFLEIIIGVNKEKLTEKESKIVSDKVKNVVECLRKFEIVTWYKPDQSGWWKLILPQENKTQLLNNFNGKCKYWNQRSRTNEAKQPPLKIPSLMGREKTNSKHKESEETYYKSQANSIRECFSKSIDQLGSENIQVRIGAIYALERIAEDSPRDHWRIMERLADFVRVKASRNEQKERSRSIPDEDIQKALTVIGRRDSKQDPPYQTLNLSNTDIRGANLKGADLQGANFKGANLESCLFRDAELQRANFKGANLQQAFLTRANLKGATLFLANLKGADLSRANLQETNLYRAKLYGAFWHEAKWEGANLDEADLEEQFFN